MRHSRCFPGRRVPSLWVALVWAARVWVPGCEDRAREQGRLVETVERLGEGDVIDVADADCRSLISKGW
jgi:hypothetical protein